ncbi:MAG: hypothetical protein GW875_03425 [Deltaproteobacteria bacterium]|nr:hypothetical protein [Deltaproteobacteria bacterium]NCP03278.1 hypothetical protein [Deltaproteobacteria bacterium]
MQEKLNLLRELQEIDQELAQAAAVRQGFEDESQGLTAEQDRVQVMADELLAQLDVLQQDLAQLRQQQGIETDQIKKAESRLPAIQTQKEYVAVLKEIDMAKKTCLETQTQISEINKQIDELEADLAEKNTSLDIMKKQTAARGKEIEALLSENEQKISARRATRESLAKDLPKSLLSKYQRIFARREGLALVGVAEGACCGCHMQLPPQQYNQLHRGTELQSCPHCNRLLYMD